MKTIVLSKFINIMCPILSINKFRKSKNFFSSRTNSRTFDTIIISTFHSSIIKKVIIISTYMNIFNTTIRILPTRSRIAISSTHSFSFTKLTIRQTIFFKISIFIIISFKIISHLSK